MSENLKTLQNKLATHFFLRPPYDAVRNLAVELTRHDAPVADAELRAALGALDVAIRTSLDLAPLCEENPRTRADEQRAFIVAMLKLLASAAGRKVFAEMIEAVKDDHADRLRELEAAARAQRLEQQIRREAQWRAEAAAMSIEQIITEIEKAGYALEVHGDKLLAPKNFPLIHRFRVELRRNEVIEFLKRRAEQAAATEEV